LSPPDAFYGIFYVQNPFAAGAPPRTPLGELTALPRPIAGGEGARCPLPKNATPTLGPSGLALRPFRPQSSALRASSLAPRLGHAFTLRQYRQAQHPYLKIPSYGPADAL